MRNNPYTSKEDKIIIEMNKAGYKPKDIAQVLLSRPESGIRDRGYNLGIKWTPEPAIDMEAYKKLMKGK